MPNEENDQPRIARSLDEIQRAHDIMVGIIVDKELTELIFPEGADGHLAYECLKANTDVLCWLLGHTHNTTFAANLAGVERVMEALGYLLGQASSPVQPKGTEG